MNGEAVSHPGVTAGGWVVGVHVCVHVCVGHMQPQQLLLRYHLRVFFEGLSLAQGFASRLETHPATFSTSSVRTRHTGVHSGPVVSALLTRQSPVRSLTDFCSFVCWLETASLGAQVGLRLVL